MSPLCQTASNAFDISKKTPDFFFFFFYNNDLQLETKSKPKTYNSAPISMLCDVGGKLNVKNTKYNIKIYCS